MRKISILLALVAGFFVTKANADFTGKNAVGTVITFKNPGDCTSVVCVPEQQIVDSTGTAVLGTTTDAVATVPASASAATAMALWKALVNVANNPPNLTVNGANQGLTGLTPGSAQTGTIFALNSDNTSWAGTALGAPSNFGTSPGAVKAAGANSSIFYGTVAAVGDPCQTSAKSFLPITATTSLVKVIATGVSAKKIYICQLLLTTTAANNVAVFEATTATTCATSPVAVYGAGTTVATAANGFPFPANGGVSLGNGGNMVGQTTVNNNDLCIGTSAATPLTGGITYVTQ